MQHKALARSAAGLAIVALAGTACGTAAATGSAGAGRPAAHGSSSGMPMTAPQTAGLTATPAASLYASLDQLLTEHVDLTANVVQNAVTAGPSSAATKAALATLDQNTQGLGRAFGSIYGAAAQQQFLKLWRAHIGYFVSYTLGVAGHNQAQVAAAQQNLAGYVSQFGAFVSGATKLPQPAVAADLQGHVQTLETAINAIVAKSPDAGRAIEMAAMHMGGTAQVLAQGIAKDKGLAGNAAGAAAGLRASLTGLLIQHVAATAFTVQTAVAAQGNLSNPEVKGAISALADNTNSLGTAIGSVYGAAAQQQFLTLWRAHIGYFVNYTLGLATHDSAKVATARRDLGGYISSFAAFTAGATKLPEPALAADLQGHVSTLETAISNIVTASPGTSASLLAAEDHMAGTGAVLSQGIVSSTPAKFSS